MQRCRWRKQSRIIDPTIPLLEDSAEHAFDPRSIASATAHCIVQSERRSVADREPGVPDSTLPTEPA